MSALLAHGALLAEIGDNFPNSGPRLNWSDLWAYGIALIAAAIIIAISMFVRHRNDMTVKCDNPWKLFRELCQVHGLDRPSQRLLAHLAEARRFEQPAQVFLTPTAFDVATLPPSLRHRVDHLQRLKSLLF